MGHTRESGVRRPYISDRHTLNVLCPPWLTGDQETPEYNSSNSLHGLVCIFGIMFCCLESLARLMQEWVDIPVDYPSSATFALS